MGWYGGAALGVKLALDKGTPGSGKFVAAIVGDGTFLFAVPASVYWISRRYKIPFLTVVLNNKGKEILAFIDMAPLMHFQGGMHPEDQLSLSIQTGMRQMLPTKNCASNLLLHPIM